MLERVSPSAECAAHIFLRRFEAPIRSARTLGPAFWRNGSEDINIPAWWPTYLDSVRSKSQVAPCISHSRFSNSHGPPVTPRPQGLKPLNQYTRTFTNSTSRTQVAAAQIGPEQDVDSETKTYVNGKILNTEIAITARPGTSEQHRGKSLQRARSNGRDESHLVRAWDDFMENSQKNNASLLLHLLATGQDPQHLERALSAFDIIPERRRVAKDYRTAVEVSARLGRYSITIQLMKRAVARNRSQKIFFDFLAFCVSNSLWTTAAELWRTVAQDEPQPGAGASISNKQNFAGHFISSFNIVPDLPLRVVTLVNRLSENDPILASCHADLQELCKKLALLAVESEKVMGLVTEDGVLSLLGTQSKLQFHSKLHSAALATLHHISSTRVRSQLAMVIYKDLKSVRSRRVPKWIIGTMIDICSVGKHNPAAYQSLLEDYRQAYGTPDKDIYLRVMRACANQGEADAVSTLFTEFRTYFQPNVADDMNPLIRAHAVTGNHQEAQKQFDRVETEFGLEQSVRNWNALILAYSRAGEYDRAYQKFQEMRHNKFTPDKYTWSMVVALASKRGDTKRARDLVAEAQQAGIAPSLPMIGAVVDSCLLNGDIKEASSLVNETTRALKTDSFQESPTRLWNSLFRFHAFKADFEAIARTQERMKKMGVKPDGMTYAALMTALVVQGRTDDAAHILRTLNFSQALSATAFHYSILIHGYAVERKRDQAQILYNEMLTSFPRATPSAQLAMLHLQGIRDEEQARSAYLAGGPNLKPDFRPTLKHLKEILADTTTSDMASSTPNPGFGRKSSPGDLERTYLDTLIKFLHRNNAYDSSKMISQTLTNDRGSLTPNVTAMAPSWSSSLDTLSDNLEVSIDSQEWIATSRIWQQILDLALRNCVSTEREGRFPATKSSTVSAARNLSFVKGPASQFSGMIPQVSKPVKSVLPAHQYVLSRPLSQYIVALDRQREYEQLITTMQTLRDHGFSLSGKNWNSLIQALCRSTNERHGLFAFQLFERFLLKNAPSWDVIRRGQWVSPSEERQRHKGGKLLKGRDDRKSRKLLEKSMPDLAMPSYYTMVHLGIVWLNASRSSSKGDHTIRRQLEARSPGTVKLVMKAPYLQDRIQGVLLRGRQVIGDRSKRPRQPQASDKFAGIQGSRLLVDQISPDMRMDLETTATMNDKDLHHNDLEKAESVLGQITRSAIILPSKGRFETHQERRKRIMATTRRKLLDYANLIAQIRKDSELGLPMVGTVARGQVSPSHRDTVLHVPNKEMSPDERQPTSLRKINTILRNVGKQPLHQLSAIYARRYESKARRDTLLRPQTVRLGVTPTEQGFLVARALRVRDHTNKIKSPKVKSGTSSPRQKSSLQPKTMSTGRIMRFKPSSSKRVTKSARFRARPAKVVRFIRQVLPRHTRRRLLPLKPRTSTLSDREFMAVFGNQSDGTR